MAHNTKEYMREYMRKYVKNATDCTCEICGKHYKSYRKYRHNKSNYHKKMLNNTNNNVQPKKKMLNNTNNNVQPKSPRVDKYKYLLEYCKKNDIELYDSIINHLCHSDKYL